MQAFWVCCSSCVLLPFWAGPLMQYTYAHDAFIFLDGGWRVLHGQRPQIDFSTNLGPIMFLYTALGIKIPGAYMKVVAMHYRWHITPCLALPSPASLT